MIRPGSRSRSLGGGSELKSVGIAHDLAQHIPSIPSFVDRLACRAKYLMTMEPSGPCIFIQPLLRGRLYALVH